MLLAREHIQQGKCLYLSISYLSDLLGLEHSFGLTREWITAAAQNEFELEIRTKSDGYAAIQDIQPTPRVILVWSLSPAEASKHESGTASFQQRIFDAARAAQRGWRIRLCFDPILYSEHWEQEYRHAVAAVFARISPAQIEAVSLGAFRMNPDFLERMKQRQSTLIHSLPLQVESGNAAKGSKNSAAYTNRKDASVTSYTEALRTHLFAVMQRELLRYIPAEKIHTVHG